MKGDKGPESGSGSLAAETALERLRSEVEALQLQADARATRVQVFELVTRAIQAGECELDVLEAIAAKVSPNDLVHMAYQLGRVAGVREGLAWQGAA